MTTLFRTAMGDTPFMRILETMIEGRELDHSLSDIAEISNVSWTTLHRVWPRIVKLNVVKRTRNVGRAKMFILNRESKVAQQLIRLYDTILVEGQKPEVVVDGNL